MDELLDFLLKKIVDKPEDISIDKIEDDHTIVFTVKVSKEDFGRVVGRKGKTINAIRSLLNLKLYKSNQGEKDQATGGKRVVIKLEESQETG